METHKALDSAYDRLRIADERLREGWLEYCRLMTLQLTLMGQPHPPASTQAQQFNSYRWSGFGDQAPAESEWWATHYDRLTYWGNGRRLPCSKLKEELKYWETWREDFALMQGNIRKRINELSSPYIRHLSISDLPNELLLEVFNVFEYRFNPGPICRDWGTIFGWGRTRDISNIRLVCRRFHDLVSQKLIPIVTVKVNDKSLTRLEKISRHPIFAKSVRLVCVVPHFYNSAFADFNRFVSHYTAQLRAEANDLDSRAIVYKDVHSSVISELVSNARAVASTLERFTSPAHSTGGEVEQYRTQVDEIHREYVARLRNQEELMTSGRFSRTIASAMIRMPGARDLQFGSYDHCGELLGPGNIVWDAVFEFMRWPVHGTLA